MGDGSLISEPSVFSDFRVDGRVAMCYHCKYPCPFKPGKKLIHINGLFEKFFFFDFSTGMTASATEAAFQLCPDTDDTYTIFPGYTVGWLGQWE